MNNSSAELSAEAEMANWGRLLMDGIPYADLVAASLRDESVPWFDYWMTTAAGYERAGERAVAAGHRESAAEFLLTASLCAQYAQFLWFGDNRAEGQARKVELYLKAAPYMDPPAERFDLSIDDVTIPGYLRVAAGGGPRPCAVLIGGLESTKEESYQFEELLIARGIATAAFDGPGQGEMWASTPARGDFERYTSRVLDHLVQDRRLDAARLVVVGRSLGGHYALRSASLDHRLAACVSWGGYVNFGNWEGRGPLSQESWRYVSKSADLLQAQDFVERCLDARNVLEGLRVPTYFLHGALDFVPVSQVDVLRQYAVNADLTLVVEPGGDHCCHNLGPRPRLEMADWIADQVRS